MKKTKKWLYDDDIERKEKTSQMQSVYALRVTRKWGVKRGAYEKGATRLERIKRFIRISISSHNIRIHTQRREETRKRHTHD